MSTQSVICAVRFSAAGMGAAVLHATGEARVSANLSISMAPPALRVEVALPPRGGAWTLNRDRRDRDGDGVPDHRDRRPNDPIRR